MLGGIGAPGRGHAARLQRAGQLHGVELDRAVAARRTRRVRANHDLQQAARLRPQDFQQV